MSNVFEALQKSRKDLLQLIAPVNAQAGRAADAPSSPGSTASGSENGSSDALQTVAAVRRATSLDSTPIREVELKIASREPIFPFDDSHPGAAEEYRIIRTKIAHHAAVPKVIVVSSAGPRDGKTVTSINLAAALSLKSTTLLMDGDFRRSSIAARLGISPEPGLASILDGTADAGVVLMRAQQFPNLYIAPAGKSRFKGSELLEFGAWRAFLSDCRAAFEYVVIDSPPIGAVADYDLLAAAADGIVMVIRPDFTRRRLAYEAMERIPKEKLIGVVMNGVKPWLFGRRHTYDQY